MKRRASSLFVWISALLAACWVIGRIIRDVNRLFAVLLYIPSPVILVMSTAAAIMAWRHGRRKLAGMLAVAAVAAALYVGAAENQWGVQPAAQVAPPLRLVHWNVYWGHLGWAEIDQQLREDRPDVLVLNEAPSDLSEPYFAKIVGDEGQAIHANPMAVAVHGRIIHSDWIAQAEGYRVYEVDCLVESAPLRIHAVDLSSTIRNERDPALRAILRLAETRAADIVAGDFNAPRRSRALASLPRGFRHAYEVAGSGWSYTWPMPAPMLDLDQCIVGPRVHPHAYLLPLSIRSDHVRQVFDFSIAGR